MWIIKSGRFHPLLFTQDRSNSNLFRPVLTTPLDYTPLRAHIHTNISKMYTHTPNFRFLVLSADISAPFHPENKFLVLSPTESGPDPRAFEEQAVSESSSTDQSPNLTSQEHHRSNSSSSTSTVDSQFNDLAGKLPNGFLYLGHPNKGRKGSQ